MKITEFISKAKNYFEDHRRIYIDKSAHPIWSTYQTHPPVKYTFSIVSNLNHFFNRFPRIIYKPFIVEAEHLLHLSGKSRDYEYMLNSVDEIGIGLENSLCKRIIVPTIGAKRELQRYFESNDIIRKVEIIHPPYEKKPEKKFVANGKFKILNIGNKFWGKGTHLAIEIFKRIRAKYYFVEMDLVCGDVPKNYSLPSGINHIRTPALDSNVRAKLYGEAHVFLFPCLHDSFGVYQECMAYGVPMIATDIYDKDELILEGETGFLVETPLSMYDGEFGIKWKTWDEFQQIAKEMFENGEFEDMIEEMVSKIEILINDRELLKSMSIESQKYQQQEFSIEKRNKDILKVYDEVLEEIK
ncbi:MAG: glycosyltransferase family 4 protein [Methanosarcinaceae archaeon]